MTHASEGGALGVQAAVIGLAHLHAAGGGFGGLDRPGRRRRVRRSGPAAGQAERMAMSDLPEAPASGRDPTQVRPRSAIHRAGQGPALTRLRNAGGEVVAPSGRGLTAFGREVADRIWPTAEGRLRGRFVGRADVLKTTHPSRTDSYRRFPENVGVDAP